MAKPLFVRWALGEQLKETVVILRLSYAGVPAICGYPNRHRRRPFKTVIGRPTRPKKRTPAERGFEGTLTLGPWFNPANRVPTQTV